MTAIETTERRTFLILWDDIRPLLKEHDIPSDDFEIVEATVDREQGIVLTALRLKDDEVPAAAADEEAATDEPEPEGENPPG